MPSRDDFGPLPGERPAFQDATASNPELYADPNVVDFGPQKKPWYARYLEAKKQQMMDPNQQPQAAAGDSPIGNWQSLGAGVGNLARKLIGMENGGAVQGPTEVLIGEGGETEYVLPESKIPVWIQRTLAEGVPPNPADVPRGGYMPPPPVILPPNASERTGTRPPPPVILPPQMCNGGKVMPKMAQGGMVMPRRVESAMPDPVDFFNPGDDMVAYNETPQFAPPPASIPLPQRPLPSMPAPSFAARERLAKLAAQGPPVGKWYERLVTNGGEGGGQLDMRPGVAPYSVAGRAANRALNAILPVNRKREQFGREYNAAQMAAETEAAQNTATQKGYESQRAEAVARSQMDANDARRIAEEARAAKLSAPPKPKDPYEGMVEVTPEFGKKAGIVAGPDGKFRLPQGAVRIPTEQRPASETPEQAFARRKTEAAQLGLKQGTPDYLNYMAGRNVSRPPRAAGGGPADAKDGVALSADEEALAKGIAEGRFQPTAATGKRKTAILARADELGYAGGTQSASDAKIGGIVETLPNELEKIRQIIKSGYRAAVAGYQSGTNRELVRLIDNAADKVGRLRSGGAINKDEEARFIRQLGMEKADLIMGDSDAADKAIDGVLAESNAVKSRMKPGRQQGDASIAVPAAPAAGASASPKWTKHTSGVEGVEMTKDGQTVFIEKSKYGSATKKGWKVKGK